MPSRQEWLCAGAYPPPPWHLPQKSRAQWSPAYESTGIKNNSRSIAPAAIVFIASPPRSISRTRAPLLLRISISMDGGAGGEIQPGDRRMAATTANCARLLIGRRTIRHAYQRYPEAAQWLGVLTAPRQEGPTPQALQDADPRTNSLPRTP